MRSSLLFIVIILTSIFASSQEESHTWKGYLADQMCAFRWRGDLAETYAKRHARSCNFDEACMASGYGILVDGSFIKLTVSSNTKAIAYLESITKRNDIFVKVTGEIVEDKLEVKTIETAEREDEE